jgi:hypothetical protein
MKYPIIVSILAISLFAAVRMGVFSPSQAHADKIVTIAQQMHKTASLCKSISSQEMEKRRLQILNDNQDATLTELLKAIEMEIDGTDVLRLLKSFKCDACDEYAKSVEYGHTWGKRGIKLGYGDMLIKDLLKDGWL